MTAAAAAIPQCHAGVRGHEKVGSSEILVLMLSPLKTFKTAMRRPCHELASRGGGHRIRLASAPLLQAVVPAAPFRARAVVQATAFAALLTSRPEMAPQAFEKAQNAPGNGARRRRALCSQPIA
jgi:hypothetical protein